MGRKLFGHKLCSLSTLDWMFGWCNKSCIKVMKEFNRYIPGNNSLPINEEKLFIVWTQQLPGLCCAVEAAAGSSSLGLSNIWYIGPGSGSWSSFQLPPSVAKRSNRWIDAPCLRITNNTLWKMNHFFKINTTSDNFALPDENYRYTTKTIFCPERRSRILNFQSLLGHVRTCVL